MEDKEKEGGEAQPQPAAPKEGREGSSTATSSWRFEVPAKRIVDQPDVRKFHASNAYRILMDWIKGLNASVIGVPNSAECYESDVPSPFVFALEFNARRFSTQHIKAIRGLVAKISKLVNDTPPEEGSWRFGNRAFRTFHAKLTEVT